MFRWLSASRKGGPRSWYTLGAAVISGALGIGVLLVAVSHRDAGFPTTRDCPSASRVNEALGTHVRSPTSVGQSDLLGCFYQQGSDPQAVSVSFATTSIVGPCRKHVPVKVSGHEGCTVAGSRPAGPATLSLLVESPGGQDEFSVDLHGVSLVRLKGLATAVLAAPPPHLRPAAGT